MNGEYNRDSEFVKYYKIVSIYLSILVVSSPFVWWPWAIVAFELPRVWFTLAAIDFLFVLAFPITIRYINRVFTQPIIRIMALFLGTIIISIIYGVDMSKSWWGNWWRLDGLVTIIHLMLAGIIVGICPEEVKHRLAISLGVGALAMSIWVDILGLLFLFNVDTPNIAGAIGATFGQPNFLAGYLVVMLSFVYFAYLNLAQKLHFPWLKYLIFLIVIAAICFTKSIGGVAGIALYLALIIFDLKTGISQRLKTIGMIVGIGVVLALVSYSLIKAAQLPPQILAESRSRIFMKGLIGFTQRPLTGWGWANFDHAFVAVDWPYHYAVDAYVDKAHSNLLEVLVTTGILGFLAYLWLIFTVGKSIISQIKNSAETLKPFYKTLLFFLILYLFHSQTNITSIAEELPFWLVVGMTIVLK
jgi:O-antigen ligase